MPKYLVMDIESFRNNVPWDPPADKPDLFPPISCHGIAAIGGLMIEVADDQHSDKKNRCSFLGTFGLIGDESTERSRVESFIKYYREQRCPVLVTFNGRRFDILCMWMRAMAFGLPLPEFFEFEFSNRYKYRENFDIQDLMNNYGAASVGGVEQVCGVIGLPGKFDVDGSQVHDLFRAGEYQKIHSYVQCDVIEEALILIRFLHVRGDLSAVVVNNLIHSIKNAALAKNDAMIKKLIGLIDFPRLEVPYNVLNAPDPSVADVPDPDDPNGDPLWQSSEETDDDHQEAEDHNDENDGALAESEIEDGIPF